MNQQSATMVGRHVDEGRAMTKLPPVPVMYRALVERDSTFEGIFYVGVTSTGIFCRPTCPARKPKQENVEFFPSTQEALYAGYRPCNRCHPLDKERKASELVTRLLELVEQSPSGRITGRELRDLGIDPSTARRQFQRHYGMTFQAYHRARRMGMALHEIRKGESVIGAQIDHGYESASGFWEAFRSVFGTPPSKAERVECLLAQWIETPLGAMLALANDQGLYLLEFVDRRGLQNEILHLRKRTGFVVVPGSHKYLDSIANEIKAYFDGTSVKFATPIVQIGSDFEKSVWKLLRTIPAGKTESYAWMAAKLDNLNATRAVGRANGRNVLAIIVPCHRVIRSDGSLCGYGGGIWRKQWLLEHERKPK